MYCYIIGFPQENYDSECDDLALIQKVIKVFHSEKLAIEFVRNTIWEWEGFEDKPRINIENQDESRLFFVEGELQLIMARAEIDTSTDEW